MIRYLNEGDNPRASEFVEAAELDPIAGARPQTLYRIFDKQYKDVDFWVQYDLLDKPAAAISRYGSQLYVAHGTNAILDELEEFVRFIGGYEFICTSPSLAVMLKDLGETTYSVKMSFDAQPFPDDDFDLIAKPALSDVYDLLCDANPIFEEQANRAAWHVHTSHLVRHKIGYCVGIVREDGKLISTGGVYNSGVSYGVIAGLATLSDVKGNGYGGLICRYLVNKILLENKTPALFAATERLTVYYGSMGFVDKGKWCEIRVREKKADRKD